MSGCQTLHQDSQDSKNSDFKTPDQNMSQNTSLNSSPSGIRYSPISDFEDNNSCCDTKAEEKNQTKETPHSAHSKDDAHSLAMALEISNSPGINLDSSQESKRSTDSESDIAPTPMKVMRMEMSEDIQATAESSFSRSFGVFHNPNINNLASFRLLKTYESESESMMSKNSVHAFSVASGTINNSSLNNSPSPNAVSSKNSSGNSPVSKSTTTTDNESK